jgi:hypothetical protein
MPGALGAQRVVGAFDEGILHWSTRPNEIGMHVVRPAPSAVDKLDTVVDRDRVVFHDSADAFQARP